MPIITRSISSQSCNIAVAPPKADISDLLDCDSGDDENAAIEAENDKHLENNNWLVYNPNSDKSTSDEDNSDKDS